MKYEIVPSNQFKKDVKLAQKRCCLKCDTEVGRRRNIGAAI